MKKLIALAPLLFPLIGYTANMSFLRNSVLTDFSKNEIKDFRAFARESLSKIEDKKVATWKSSTSEVEGKFKAISSYKTNDKLCRHSRFLVSKGDNNESYQFEICNINGQWKIQDTPLRDLTNLDIEKIKFMAKIALNHQGKSTPFSWHNKETKSSGVLVPLPISTEKNGSKNSKTCRNMAVTVFNKIGQSANGTYKFCKTGDDEWQRVIEPL